MKAAALILVFIAAIYIAEHWHEPPQLAVTKAAIPTANAPLLMPPQFCPSPLPICIGKDCPAPRRSAA